MGWDHFVTVFNDVKDEALAISSPTVDSNVTTLITFLQDRSRTFNSEPHLSHYSSEI
jgi:hypothetical protein